MLLLEAEARFAGSFCTMAKETRRNLCVPLILLLLALLSVTGAAFLYRELLGLRVELRGYSEAWFAALETTRREAAERDEREARLIQGFTAFTSETAGRFDELLRNQKELRAGLAELPGLPAGLPDSARRPAPEEDYPLYRLRAGLGELFKRGAFTECVAAACELLDVYPLDAEARLYRGASLLRLNPADSEALLASRRDLQLALEQLPDDSRIPPLLAEIALEEGAWKDADEP